MPRGRKPKPKITPEYRPPPPAPDHLSADARAEFDRLASFLANKRVVSDEDSHAIEVYATSLVLYRQSQKAIDAEGAVIDGANDLRVKNPWLTVQNSAWDRIRPLLAMFGLTPADRQRLKMAEAKPDPAADFFDKAGGR